MFDTWLETEIHLHSWGEKNIEQGLLHFLPSSADQTCVPSGRHSTLWSWYSCLRLVLKVMRRAWIFNWKKNVVALWQNDSDFESTAGLSRSHCVYSRTLAGKADGPSGCLLDLCKILWVVGTAELPFCASRIKYSIYPCLFITWVLCQDRKVELVPRQKHSWGR